MKRNKAQSLCLIFFLLAFMSFNSCKSSQNIFQRASEVDFSTPQKVQISFNGHIYDTSIALNNSKLEINFINEKDLINGAYICFKEENYKLTYKDMVFEGVISDLSPSFLPCVIYEFVYSFEDKILLDSYDEEKECYFLKKEINGRFITFECFENKENKFYSMEIK